MSYNLIDHSTDSLLKLGVSNRRSHRLCIKIKPIITSDRLHLFKTVSCFFSRSNAHLLSKTWSGHSILNFDRFDCRLNRIRQLKELFLLKPVAYHISWNVGLNLVELVLGNPGLKTILQGLVRLIENPTSFRYDVLYIVEHVIKALCTDGATITEC